MRGYAKDIFFQRKKNQKKAQRKIVNVWMIGRMGGRRRRKKRMARDDWLCT